MGGKERPSRPNSRKREVGLLVTIILVSLGSALAIVAALWLISTAQMQQSARALKGDVPPDIKFREYSVYPIGFWVIVFIVILVLQTAVILTGLGGRIG